MVRRHISITSKTSASSSTSETPLFLSFSNLKSVTNVTVYVTGENVPDELREDEMHSIPVSRGITLSWILEMQDAMFMKQLVNGVVDGEVIPEYAKYAIEHMANESGGKCL